VSGDIAIGAAARLDRRPLEIDRHSDVGYSPIRKCRAARKLNDVLDVRWSHHARVVDAASMYSLSNSTSC
jgi:hypothetical protein